MTGGIRIVSTRLPILVQDGGRPGYAALGVPRSGAFDRAAGSLAQRLVGNGPDAPGLEITLGGVTLRTEETITAAVTGADADIRVAGQRIAVNEVVSWRAGTDLVLREVSGGVRNYLAVRGGFGVRPVLGSCATDMLSGLGPAPLQAGDHLAFARGPAADPVVSHAPATDPARGPLHVLLGPRHGWFTAAALAALRSAVYTVGPDSDRVGLRLLGPALERSRRTELPSEPLQRGALQVPPGGRPILLGPDHPTTGGYPVIATVASTDWDICGQLRPGDRIRFEVLPD